MFRRNECDLIAQMLWDYADNALDSLDTDRVTAHLERCEPCRRESQSFRMAAVGVASERNEIVPESNSTWMELRATLERENRLISAPRPLVRRVGPAWAVAFAGAFAAVVFWKLTQP